MALRTALRVIIRSMPEEIAQEIGDDIRIGQQEIEATLIAAAKDKGSWAVVRYRSFAKTVNEIADALLARGRGHQ